MRTRSIASDFSKIGGSGRLTDSLLATRQLLEEVQNAFDHQEAGHISDRASGQQPKREPDPKWRGFPCLHGMCSGHDIEARALEPHKANKYAAC